MAAKRPLPHVGIFWLVRDRLVTDTTPLSEAPTYADFKIHEPSHIRYWNAAVAAGRVPVTEYEEYPRGRVAFNNKTQRFTFLADRCILRDKGLVARLMQQFGLPPKQTDVGPDSHYRCLKCLEKEEDSCE